MNSLAACFRSYWSTLSLSLLLSEDEQKLWILLRSSGTGMQPGALTSTPLITHTMRGGPWRAQQASACPP